MDVDLREQVAQILSPDVARQLASTVGMDDGQGKAFVAAAIPALLSAMIDSSAGGGAQALSDAVSNSDPNTLERLRRALAARDLQPLNEGANALQPVLGAAERDKLANRLADYVETPVEAALPALGAVEQAIVAALGQQDPSLWSDAGALRNFLGSQKSAVAAAIPAALGQAAAAPVAAAPVAAAPVAAAPVAAAPVAAAPVAAAPVAAAPVAAAPVAAAPVAAAPVAAAPPPPPAPRIAPPPPPPQASGGGGSWWLIVIVIVVVAAAAYFYWTRTHAKPEAGFLTPGTQHAHILTGVWRG